MASSPKAQESDIVKPKILLFDIETAPILAYVWGLFDQNVGLNQIHSDWYVLSWSAKWLGDSQVMYQDQRSRRDIENDKQLLQGIWDLLDEADIVITQNGKQFDVKKLNARFVAHGFQPPAPFKHIDTLEMAKRVFGFTSNKLEYMTNKLCTKYKKLTKRKFSGFDLWRECLGGNDEAWNEMEKYNKQDVLSLEELYEKMAPWGNKINFNIYGKDDHRCNCGSINIQKRGYDYLVGGRYQRYQCKDCGAWSKGSKNLATHRTRRVL